MAVIRAGNQADYAFKVDGLAANKLLVVQFVGSEGVSELFRYRLDLVSPDAELDFGAIVGQTALLTIQGPKGKRYIHGLVSEFELTAKGERLTSYRAEVVPMVWTLTHRADCRIFQNETVPDIIKTILEDAGLQANEHFRIKVSASYQPSDYCVQYRETDWSFISRLMEQYGMFYFFEHTEKSHVLVVGDDASIHDAIPAPAAVVYHQPGGPGALTDQEHISGFRYAQAVRSGKVTIDDFDFKKPSLELKSETSTDTDTQLALYDYPGEYVTGDEGKSLAKRWIEEVQASRRIGSGEGDCRRLIPGYRFTLDKYDRSELNQEYLLLRVSHRGAQPQSVEVEGDGGEGVTYQNDFECIPATVPFRPPRLTPKPAIQGPQTAVVVGPSGEEIYTDDYGRVKVQFHWDRRGQNNEKSSCWIRVAQLWAGAGWGAIFIPRIKQEVIVEFLEGDPDRPIITGRVYNGEHMPPYKLPDQKTKSTIKSSTSKGGVTANELLIEDLKDKSQVVLSSAYGHKLTEDEETQAFTLETRDQHIILLDDKNKLVNIKTTNAHSVTMDDDKKVITIRSTDGYSIELSDENEGITVQTKNGHVLRLDDQNKKIEVVTTDGHSMILDDDNQKIGLTSTSGHSLTLDDSGDSITLEDSKGNLVKLDTGGSKIVIEIGSGDIDVSAASGKISLKAMDVEIAADNELKLSGGMKGTLDGGIESTVKGVTTKVEGSAMTEVKGALVKIN